MKILHFQDRQSHESLDSGSTPEGNSLSSAAIDSTDPSDRKSHYSFFSITRPVSDFSTIRSFVVDLRGRNGRIADRTALERLSAHRRRVRLNVARIGEIVWCEYEDATDARKERERRRIE